MMRCTGALLSWLSDNPYPNFIVATSNSLRRMGEIGLTMTRSERFDASFFIDVPGASARRAMLERWLDGKLADSQEVATRVSEVTEKFSRGDLRSTLVFHVALGGLYVAAPLITWSLVRAGCPGGGGTDMHEIETNGAVLRHVE